MLFPNLFISSMNLNDTSFQRKLSSVLMTSEKFHLLRYIAFLMKYLPLLSLEELDNETHTHTHRVQGTSHLSSLRMQFCSASSHLPLKNKLHYPEIMLIF